MVGPDIRNRLASILDAVKKVLHVTAWLLSFAQLHNAFVKQFSIRVSESLVGTTFNFSAIDEDPSL